jgi:hypothetical protein
MQNQQIPVQIQSDYSPEFVIRCCSDFLFFCEKVLNYELTNFHKEIALLPLQHRYLVIVIPRGHSKTALFSIGYSLWRLFKERNKEICIISSSLDQSIKLLAKIQDILENNSFFASLLPKERNITWNKTQLNTMNRNKLYVKPANSSIRGIHPHYFVIDDLLREGDTPMDEIIKSFWTDVFPCGQINGCQFVVVGTPFSDLDLYSNLASKKEWVSIRKSAVIEDEQGNWLRPLWEKTSESGFGFTLEELKDIKDSMGDAAFAREYLCKPEQSGDYLYPQELILNSLDYNLEYSYDCKGMAYTGMDFAMSTEKSGDFNVFIVVDHWQGGTYNKQTDKGIVTIENPVFLRQMIRFKGNTGQIESAKILNQHFPMARMIADESGVGAKFIKEMREESLPVSPQKFQPDQRNLLLLNLRRLLDQGRLVIPCKGMSEPLTNILIREMSGFKLKKMPSGRESFHSSLKHDDCVVSLAMSVKDISNPRKVMQDLFFGY